MAKFQQLMNIQGKMIEKLNKGRKYFQFLGRKSASRALQQALLTGLGSEGYEPIDEGFLLNDVVHLLIVVIPLQLVSLLAKQALNSAAWQS